MSEDAGVEVHLDHPGNWAEEEDDQAEDHEVVEEPRVILAATVLCLLLPINCDDEVECADNDNQDSEDTDAEGDADSECLNVGLCLGLDHHHQLRGVVLGGVEALASMTPISLQICPDLFIHHQPLTRPLPGEDVERLVLGKHPGLDVVQSEDVVIEAAEAGYSLLAV